MRRQRRLEQFLRDLPLVGPQAEKGVEAFKAAVREFLQPPAFFEALGVRYVGPIDGHDIEELEHALRNAIELRPRARSSSTSSPRRAAATRRPRTTTRSTSTTRRCSTRLIGPPKAVPTGYTQAFAEAIIKEAEADPQLVAITAAMPGPTGLLPFEDRFPDRFFDVGIAEQHAVTGAAGMAMGGLRPVVAIYSHVPQPGVGPGRLRRRPAPAAGRLLPRPRRHHRRRRRRATTACTTWRCCPRCPACACSRRRAPRSCSRCSTTRSSSPTTARWRSATRTAPRRRSAEHEVGVGLRGPPAARAATASVCILAVGKLVATPEQAAAVAGRAGHRRRRCGTSAAAPPLDPAMIADAAATRLVVTCEDGMRDGGIGMTIADQVHDDRRRRGRSRCSACRAVHPAGQARPHPRPARPRRRRHRRRGARSIGAQPER